MSPDHQLLEDWHHRHLEIHQKFPERFSPQVFTILLHFRICHPFFTFLSSGTDGQHSQLPDSANLLWQCLSPLHSCVWYCPPQVQSNITRILKKKSSKTLSNILYFVGSLSFPQFKSLLRHFWIILDVFTNSMTGNPRFCVIGTLSSYFWLVSLDLWPICTTLCTTMSLSWETGKRNWVQTKTTLAY